MKTTVVDSAIPHASMYTLHTPCSCRLTAQQSAVCHQAVHTGFHSHYAVANSQGKPNDAVRCICIREPGRAVTACCSSRTSGHGPFCPLLPTAPPAAAPPPPRPAAWLKGTERQSSCGVLDRLCDTAAGEHVSGCALKHFNAMFT